MDPFETELEAFFDATRAPQEDEAFVWRAIEEYERRTRLRAIGARVLRAAGFAFALLAMSSLGPSLDAAEQSLVADGLRLTILVAVLGTALAYAARTLAGESLLPAMRPVR